MRRPRSPAYCTSTRAPCVLACRPGSLAVSWRTFRDRPQCASRGRICGGDHFGATLANRRGAASAGRPAFPVPLPPDLVDVAERILEAFSPSRIACSSPSGSTASWKTSNVVTTSYFSSSPLATSSFSNRTRSSTPARFAFSHARESCASATSKPTCRDCGNSFASLIDARPLPQPTSAQNAPFARSSVRGKGRGRARTEAE
jgi:hypothetical protein